MAIRSMQFFILSLFAVFGIFLSIFKGNTWVDSYQLLKALGGDKSAQSYEIVFLLRLPHALTAFVAGGLLALAGAMMQVLVRNPLADPYILGVSGGAAVATLLMILLGFGGYWLTGGAWFGSLFAILTVFLLARGKYGDAQQLLLTGIAFASAASACVSLILLASNLEELRGMLFWLVGDLSYARIPVVEGAILLLGLVVSLCFARDLNILVRGKKEARALGVNTKHLQWKLYLLSSLLTATAVTLAGCIGFVGLIVPHLFRLACGYDHRFLLPGCVLLGGSFLTIADVVARSLFFPIELPVGIVMTLVGAPVFVFLLQRKAGNSYANNEI